MAIESTGASFVLRNPVALAVERAKIELGKGIILVRSSLIPAGSLGCIFSGADTIAVEVAEHTLGGCVVAFCSFAVPAEGFDWNTV